MKSNRLYILFFICIISFGCSVVKFTVRFEIKKEHPAIGLTLGYMLPEEQLQKIVGNKFKPIAKDGMGFLMLFISTSPKYYMNNVSFDNLAIAHIVIPVEGKYTINAPLSIAPENQSICKTLKQFGFKTEVGKVNMNLTTAQDSMTVFADIVTSSGNITLHSTFLNKPGEIKNIDSTTVNATNNPNSFFFGPESFQPIQIPSIHIQHTGKNWITELQLPDAPSRIWLNINFVWDFIFMKNKS